MRKNAIACALLGALLAAMLGSATTAGANHGQGLTLEGPASGGSTVRGAGTYDSGDNNIQTWIFSIVVTNAAGVVASFPRCEGFGSVEVGFTANDPGCVFTVGGIGHTHGYPYVPDPNSPGFPGHAHPVTFSGGGVTTGINKTILETSYA